MRCIFCKKPSGSSRSEEHIVPESLGNKSHVLPPGIVCDGCNNYFARKIEGPLLSEGPLRVLRFHQCLPSKRNRVPPMDGVMLPDVRVRLCREPDGATSVAVPPEGFSEMLSGREGTLVFPAGAEPFDSFLWPRLLAKCALEALAQRLLSCEQDVVERHVVEHGGLDILRRFARYGEPRRWPISERQLYASHRNVVENGKSYQTLFEYDLLFATPENLLADGTIQSELYFVLVLFGREFAINMGGPEIDGYHRWLERHGGVSPLYVGKNAFEPSPSGARS